VLTERWAAGPLTHLGLGVPDFPNMFVVAGPGSPAVFSNLTLAAEQQVNWILELLEYCRDHRHAVVAARQDAAQAWTRHVDETAQSSLFPQADSWYLGANIEGKPRVFMPYIGGFKPYADECDRDRDDGYAGWHIARGPQSG
jgi:hypothetical protein